MGDVIANEVVMKDSIFYLKIMSQTIFNKKKLFFLWINLWPFIIIIKNMKRVERKQKIWKKGLNIKVQKDVQQKI
jgi:hypothetical protein